MESTSMFERRMYESRVGEPVADDTVKATKNTDIICAFCGLN